MAPNVARYYVGEGGRERGGCRGVFHPARRHLALGQRFLALQRPETETRNADRLPPYRRVLMPRALGVCVCAAWLFAAYLYTEAFLNVSVSEVPPVNL